MRQNFVEPGIASALPAEQLRAELESVLASGPFVRSERHSQFLRFVCETTLNGNAAKLNEYLIAHEVFGRGPGYSPGEDSVVRRQAHSLRQKLHDYYAGQGKHNPVRIELPVGRYVPAFVRVEDEAAADEPFKSLPAGPAAKLTSSVVWR